MGTQLSRLPQSVRLVVLLCSGLFIHRTHSRMTHFLMRHSSWDISVSETCMSQVAAADRRCGHSAPTRKLPPWLNSSAMPRIVVTKNRLYIGTAANAQGLYLGVAKYSTPRLCVQANVGAIGAIGAILEISGCPKLNTMRLMRPDSTLRLFWRSSGNSLSQSFPS